MATFACDSCHNTFASDVEPRECPKCGSRLIAAAADPGGGGGGFAPPGVPATPPPLRPPNIPSSGGAAAMLNYGRAPGTGPLAKWVLVAYAATLGLSALAILANVMVFVAPHDFYGIYYGVAGVAGLADIAAIVLGAMCLHAGWSAVQPLRAVDASQAYMPTPGRAVGFMFIPFFNVYWVFVARVGLARRANLLARDRLAGRPAISEGLATFAAVCFAVQFFLCWIPVLGILLQMANTATAGLFYLQALKLRQTLGES